MKILKGVEIPIAICISYTILSIVNAVLNLIRGRDIDVHGNSIVMLLWTSIAVLVLALHRLFEELSPVLMIVIQYVIAMGLVFASVWISGFWTEVAEGGYYDVFVSFTVPYIIGAAVYYFSLFWSVRRQNRLIQDIRKNHEKK